MAATDYSILLADIGGTHTRLAILENSNQSPKHIEVFQNRHFANLESLIKCYSDQYNPEEALLAVAGPVNTTTIELTNLDWSFTRKSLCKNLKLENVFIMNDFTAIAWSTLGLGKDDFFTLHNGNPSIKRATDKQAIGIIGPGTGLGVSGLIQDSTGRNWTAITGEGGHVTAPPANDEESRIIDALRKERGHISAETLVSGPGLVTLYQYFSEREAAHDSALTPEEVTRHAIHQQNTAAQRAMDFFFSMLGSIVGNLALTLGTHGGIYLAGGILPKLTEELKASRFLERFQNKGRFRDYLAAIPIYVITNPYPAFTGLQQYLNIHKNRITVHGVSREPGRNRL